MSAKYKRALNNIIDDCSGWGASEAFEFLASVVRGEESTEQLARMPGPDEDFASAALIPLQRKAATIGERIEAAKIMIQYRHGLPKATLEVSGGFDLNSAQGAYDRLPTAELEALEAAFTKVEKLEPVAELEEGEIVHPEPKRRIRDSDE